MAKIVYFVASHTNPEQVVRLVRALRSGSPDSQVLIHHNYSVSYLDPASIQDVNNVNILRPHVTVKWGDFSQVRMLLQAIEWIRANGSFDWVVYISGQDYPIMSLSEIEQELDATEYDGFATARRIDDNHIEDEVFTPRWYFYHYYAYRFYKLRIPRLLYKLRQNYMPAKSLGTPIRPTSANQVLPLMFMRHCRPTDELMLCFRRLRMPFTSNFHCYQGPSWWTLSRHAIEHIDEFVCRHPDFVRYHKRSHLPEDSFFLTILMNDPSLRICSDNKRYVRWAKKPSAHPAILTAEDFSQLVSSGKHFARKLDQNLDSRLLDLLDQYIGLASATKPGDARRFERNDAPRKPEPDSSLGPIELSVLGGHRRFQ
jgi:hypothetical protein